MIGFIQNIQLCIVQTKAWYANICRNGVLIPFAYDSLRKQPSITVMFPYASFIVALCSVIALHWDLKIMPATLISIMFWVLATALYMLRSITRAKIDLKNESVDLEDDEKPNPQS